jgi:hypothetical protein
MQLEATLNPAADAANLGSAPIATNSVVLPETAADTYTTISTIFNYTGFFTGAIVAVGGAAVVTPAAAIAAAGVATGILVLAGAAAGYALAIGIAAQGNTSEALALADQVSSDLLYEGLVDLMGGPITGLTATAL